jgi:Zn finger protein HypA/HybF involved in hydrogenase expression
MFNLKGFKIVSIEQKTVQFVCTDCNKVSTDCNKCSHCGSTNLKEVDVEGGDIHD